MISLCKLLFSATLYEGQLHMRFPRIDVDDNTDQHDLEDLDESDADEMADLLLLTNDDDELPRPMRK